MRMIGRATSAIAIRRESEVEAIRAAAQLVSRTLAEVAKHVRPGADAAELDAIAEAYIRDNGGTPAFKNYRPDADHNPFPYSLCVSVNEEVVHGFAAAGKRLKAGDIVAVDCGVKLNGYYGDSAYTFMVGEVAPEVRSLLEATKQSLYEGIRYAIDGGRLGDVSNAIQEHVEARGFSVVREMVGHGIGTRLHEPPEVANYGKRGSGPKLKQGMVLAIEPMINLGTKDIVRESDGWTIRTTDRKPSAHYEHTVVVRRGQAEILTTFDYIEAALTHV